VVGAFDREHTCERRVTFVDGHELEHAHSPAAAHPEDLSRGLTGVEHQNSPASEPSVHRSLCLKTFVAHDRFAAAESESDRSRGCAASVRQRRRRLAAGSTSVRHEPSVRIARMRLGFFQCELGAGVPHLRTDAAGPLSSARFGGPCRADGWRARVAQ
jgi:hypothetical protein